MSAFPKSDLDVSDARDCTHLENPTTACFSTLRSRVASLL
jgi:hypothetical protein